MTIKDSKSTIADRLLTAISNVPTCTMGIEQLYVRTMARQDPHLTQRKKQQALGPHIARLNKRLKKQHLKIQPGEARGTYSLVETKKA